MPVARSASSVRVARFGTLEALREVEPAWTLAEVTSPFASFEFAQAWLGHPAVDAEPFVLAAFDAAGGLVALAPWCITRESGLRVLTGIGLDDAWFHDPCFLRPDLAAAASACLTEALRRESGSWDFLRLVLRENESGAFLASLSGVAKVFAERVSWRQNPVADIDDWHAFLASRPGQYRTLLGRHGRKLDKTPHRYFQADSANLEGLLDEFFKLHTERWAGERPTWDPYYAAIRAECRRAQSRAELGLYVLEVEGRRAALALWLRRGDQANCVMSLFYQEFNRLSAGSLLTAHVLEHMHQLGVRHFDCGPGIHEWKKFLAARSVSTLEVIAGSPRSIRGGARAGWLGTLKPWLKQQLGKPASA